MDNKEKLNEEAAMNNNLTSSTYMKVKTGITPNKKNINNKQNGATK